MLKVLKYLLPLAGILLCISNVMGQQNPGAVENKVVDSVSVINVNNANIPPTPDSIFYIKEIIFEGNKKTREPIMLRELPFKLGDSIALKDIPEKFNTARRQLRNLTLFHDATVSVAGFEGKNVFIKISVKERWYIFPFPHFKPVDRNLNQWLFEKGASISRVDYGIKLMWDNFTGNNDKLRFYFITGYSKQITLSYQRPYIDNKMKWGVNANFAIGRNHEVNYATVNDKQVFLKSDQFLKTFFKGNIEATHRPAIFTTHHFGITYESINVNDTILKLNPNYFPLSATSVTYPGFYYRLSYKNLDYNPYPTKGYAAEVLFTKKGFSKKMNLTELGVQGIGYWHLGNKYFYSIMAAGVLKLPFKQPFVNQNLQGYGNNYLGGYEYNVIDGIAGGLIKTSFYRQFANFSAKIPAVKWLTKGNIPIKMFAKAFVNSGYVSNPQPSFNSRLTNRVLNGAGIGIDVFTAYDFTINIEFCINQLGQNGLFFHKKNIFQ